MLTRLDEGCRAAASSLSDGRVACADIDGDVKIIDGETGAVSLSDEINHRKPEKCESLTLTVNQGKPTRNGTLRGHKAKVNAIVWLKNGTCLITASSDKTLRYCPLP